METLGAEAQWVTSAPRNSKDTPRNALGSNFKVCLWAGLGGIRTEPRATVSLVGLVTVGTLFCNLLKLSAALTAWESGCSWSLHQHLGFPGFFVPVSLEPPSSSFNFCCLPPSLLLQKCLARLTFEIHRNCLRRTSLWMGDYLNHTGGWALALLYFQTENLARLGSNFAILLLQPPRGLEVKITYCHTRWKIGKAHSIGHHR